MNSLFHAKLFPLVARLATSKVWAHKAQTSWKLSCDKKLQVPKDNLQRVMLYHPAVQNTLGNTMHRYRLAYGTTYRGNYPDRVVLFETYDKEGKLVDSTEVSQLPTELALALEVELLTDLLSEHGVHVTTM